MARVVKDREALTLTEWADSYPLLLNIAPAELWPHDVVAGYEVTSVTKGQHDGHPATVAILADSFGQREVGRLVLRNDALRDAELEVIRMFAFAEERDAFDSFSDQQQTAYSAMVAAGVPVLKALAAAKAI